MGLEEIRNQIDKIDDEILSLLAKRESLSKEVGRIKKAKNKQILDKERETQLIESIKKKSEELGLNEDFVIALYKIVLENSRKEQENV